LQWLPFAHDQVLTQLLVLRLRLLAMKHNEQRQALGELLDQEPPENLRGRCQALLNEENRAVELLGEYERQALEILRGVTEEQKHAGQPSDSPPTFL
jgi:hypothetical protein